MSISPFKSIKNTFIRILIINSSPNLFHFWIIEITFRFFVFAVVGGNPLYSCLNYLRQVSRSIQFVYLLNFFGCSCCCCLILFCSVKPNKANKVKGELNRERKNLSINSKHLSVYSI